MSGAALSKLSQSAFRAALRTSRGNESDAEDAAQEALLRYLVNKPTVNNDAQIRGWFGAVGANITRSKLRHKQVCDRHDRKYTLETERFGPADAPAIRNEMADQLDAALAKLPMSYQQILRLRYIEGESMLETAKIMGIPLGTVMSRTHRALRELRRIMKPIFHDEA